MRRADHLVAMGANLPPALIIGHDQNDVRRREGFLRRLAATKESQSSNSKDDDLKPGFSPNRSVVDFHDVLLLLQGKYHKFTVNRV